MCLQACLRRCAAQYCCADGAVRAVPSQPTLELLGVIETVVALGTNRIYFSNRGRAISPITRSDTPSIRPGSSLPRLMEFALLLRRHPRLTVAIDGHEASHEALTHRSEDGSDVRCSHGRSQQRADAARDALLELECLRRVSPTGARTWGTLPSARFAERIEHCRGWEDAVATAAGWSGGLETSHAELFVRARPTIATRPLHLVHTCTDGRPTSMDPAHDRMRPPTPPH